MVPGTARLTDRPLLDFRIDRRFEVRGQEVRRRVPGRKLKEISKRPAYTDLAAHPVPVPSGFASSPPVRLVREGSMAEESCEGCAGGSLDCEQCGGSGTQKCPTRVKCRACGGGVDACWSCGGTRDRDTRKPPAKAQRQVRTDWCRRCGAHDVACPKCQGQQTMPCGVCKEKGVRPCDACKGSKRVRHDPCGGKGYFTAYVEAEISHPVESDRKRVAAPPHLWWPTSWRAGWRVKHLANVWDKLPPDLPESLRAEVEPQLALARREVARRATLRYLPVARVTVDADPEWVYFAFPDRVGAGTDTETGTDILKVVRRPAKQVVLRVAGIASGAVVIAVLAMVLVLRVIGA
ncbi:hypothetical protein [Streptomyces graminilatus]|uniref:hypothetical protein n=1 Tax=Streptomyces graminilatus TaxID=1464070 RepID=UPI0006E3348A|nr:hypothetical protein [Streptomyces graminilatus]